MKQLGHHFFGYYKDEQGKDHLVYGTWKSIPEGYDNTRLPHRVEIDYAYVLKGTDLNGEHIDGEAVIVYQGQWAIGNIVDGKFQECCDNRHFMEFLSQIVLDDYTKQLAA